MSETPSTPEKPAPPLKAIFGQKVGMTEIFDARGNVTPVTVILAGPCHVTQVLTKEKHGYSALQVAFGEVREKSVSKPHQGVFKKANVSPARWIREVRTDLANQFEAGQAIRVDAFIPGDLVDVRGLSKGKGFAGVVKRHNFGGGPSTHGQSDRQRAPGSSGSNTYPGRVFKGKKFPGHLGVENTTVQNLEVVRIMSAENLLLLRGAVPGGRESILMIEETVKRVKHRAPVVPEVKKEKAKKEPAKGSPPAAKAKGAK
jgi:large subunit ribosomal protein L3